MSKKRIATSARGVEVDFDLLKIKEEMAAVPEAENVQIRENFINLKRRRKDSSKRKVKDMLAQQQINQDAIKKALHKQKQQLSQQIDEPVENVDTSSQLDNVSNESVERVIKESVLDRRLKRGNN